MSELRYLSTPLPGVMQVQRTRHVDGRGTFARLFCTQNLVAAGWTGPMAQINHSVTSRCGTVRGLHYQLPPFAEMKLVSCVRGRIWDVAVDLRRDSPAFLQWHAQELSSESGMALLIPQGCAHGFQALSDDAEVIYCHSSPFAPTAQAGLHPCEPRLAIAWPLAVQELSRQDSNWPALDAAFMGVGP